MTSAALSRTSANLLLIAAAAIWGTAFVAQKLGADRMGPLSFTGLRFLLGTLVVLPLARRDFVRMRARLQRRHWLGMAVTGLALFAGAALQQVGLRETSATNAGFLTALYVPLVPLIGLVALRIVPHPVVWPAAAASLLGSFLLSGGQGQNFGLSLGVGDMWIVASALFWALQILLLGALAERTGAPVLVSAIQFLVCGLLGVGLGIATEPMTVDGLRQAAPAIAYTGVLSVGLAFTFQAVGQRHTSAAAAALILSSEAVFAAGAGALVLGERLPTPALAGAGLILAAILAVQLVPARNGAHATS